MNYREQPKYPTYPEENSDSNRRRFQDPDEKKQFRNAYCFKAGYDFSALKPYCDELIIVIDGLGDHFDKIRPRLEKGLADFDPNKDLIVPAGRAVDHLFIGQILAAKLADKPKAQQSYALAVYIYPDYIFFMVPLDPNQESYEILTR